MSAEPAGVPLSLVKFTGPVEVTKGNWVDRVEPGNAPRGHGGAVQAVTAVRDGAYIRLSSGQVFHAAGPRVDYWVEGPCPT